MWKRVLDLGCIILAMPVVAPLMGVIALGIKLVSPGPVFFRQERVGLGGRRFTIMKFRSMHDGASTGTHQNHLKDLMTSTKPMAKMDRRDPRVIPAGVLLRSSGLDELPQLINVWRGDMSLVGPRPCTIYEFEQYREDQKERFHTLPGLTGLWQVSGKNRTTFARMIELDIDYVRRKSPWMDVWIMLRTPVVLFLQFMEATGKRNGSPEKAPKTETIASSVSH